MEGGLPDHTDRLAAVLTAHRSLQLLTSVGVETRRSFPVHARLRTWHSAAQLHRAIAEIAPSGPLLWQYVPHMYGRGGVNFALPRVIRALHRAGRRQVVIVHEIAAPWSPWPHRAFYALAHRLMWQQISQAADALGVSTDGWLTQLRSRHGLSRGVRAPAGTVDRFFLAPSPANLPVVSVDPGHVEHWRSAQGLSGATPTVGFFGSPGSGKQFEWVLAAWRAMRRSVPATALVVVGGRPDLPLHQEEAPWFKPLGYLAAGPASAALQALDVLLLPFVDGVSERRSSFMAGLAHGLPIVTVLGPATGATLRTADFFSGVPPDLDVFIAAALALTRDPVRRRTLGDRAREAYVARYDWPRLADELVRHLG